MLRRPRARTGDDHEHGFTLIELLVTITILGIVTVPLGNLVIGFLHDANATTGRLTESHDIQLANAYFQQDVTSMGVRSTTYSGDAAAPFPMLQSVETGVAPTAGLYPCGTAGLPNAVVRFAWDDYPSGAAGPVAQVRVAYVPETTAAGSLQLHRLVCDSGGAVTKDKIVVHDLVSAVAACSSACTGSGAAVPAAVNLTVTVHDAASGTGGTYSATLTGKRRQS